MLAALTAVATTASSVQSQQCDLLYLFHCGWHVEYAQILTGSKRNRFKCTNSRGGRQSNSCAFVAWTRLEHPLHSHLLSTSRVSGLASKGRISTRLTDTFLASLGADSAPVVSICSKLSGKSRDKFKNVVSHSRRLLQLGQIRTSVTEKKKRIDSLIDSIHFKKSN